MGREREEQAHPGRGGAGSGFRVGRSGAGRFVAGAVLLLLALVPVTVLAAGLGIHQGPLETDPCKVCHDTAASVPALRGWSGTVTPFGTGWGTKSISLLCYGCHDNTGGYIIGQTASDQVANAFDDLNGSHGYVLAGIPPEPEGSAQGTFYKTLAATGLPYTNTIAGFTQLQCTSCHNVHSDAVRPFNQRASYRLLCNECHGGRGNDGGLTQTIPGATRNFSSHPTLVDVNGPAGNVNLKVAGTTMDTALAVATPAPEGWTVSTGYKLGGHLDDGTPYPAGNVGQVNCQTCHAVHGPAAGTAGLGDLLALDNGTESAGVGIGSALCEGCHYGGAAGGGLAGAGAGVDIYNAPLGEFTDHPLDGRAATSGVAGTIPNPPVTWLGAKPHLAAGTPACSSCHDMHGGMAGTPLLRGPTSGTVSGDPWVFSYDDWCFACHTAAQIIPAAHHSVINNLNLADGDPIDSQLSCGDCHGPPGSTNWAAHNGFWRFVVALSASDSLYCESCHDPADPTDISSPGLKGQSFNTSGTIFPSSHGDNTRGDASHLLGDDSDEFDGVTVNLNPWSSGYYSEYGPPNAGGGLVAPAEGPVLCESCHNILYNDGRANPGSYGGGDVVKAGWMSNLLLERYEDGGGAGASALCLGCHTAAGIHHPLTGGIVEDTGLPLITGAGSLANQTSAPIGGGAAPGTLSFPGPDAMDCDSCHRPHDADDDSTVTGADHGAKTSGDGRPTWHILEVDDANHIYTPILCRECHAK